MSSTQTLENLMQDLARAGYSNTRSRQAVVRALLAGEGCLTPAQILARGQREQPHLGLVTVYRTLEILTRLGLARKIHQEDGCHAYALAQKAHGHHLICARCQQVVEFECCDLSALLERVAQQTGYAIHEHWLELFGLCPRCQGLARPIVEEEKR